MKARAAAAWAHRAGITDRLARGSAIVARRRAAALADWVKRGRRADLTGWRAALDPLARLLGLAVLAWIGYQIVRVLPWLMWALTAGWCWAAWRAGTPTSAEQERAADAPQSSPTDAAKRSPEDTYEALLAWVREAIGERQGVHLRDLLANAQHNGLFKGLELGDFRAALERWDIPVRKRVRVRGLGVTVGVHRDDLPAPAGAPSGPLPEPEGQGDPDPRLHAA
ncbi:hypothetical protein [Streptomyces iconiensis]|uniref:Uncharacterized protein n=1 Tax=Streptomyces iconiensis TaxID=1384038 RepID=A0ABT7AAC3_9ACTN|nr:hypothetical protein [Streptomyces iconiensis]MDJ1137949.1 hypothetical protein [Streptomyces iconiensis]